MPDIVARSVFPTTRELEGREIAKAAGRKSWLLLHGLGDSAREERGGEKRPRDSGAARLTAASSGPGSFPLLKSSK